MEASKVYYTTFRTEVGRSVLDKLQSLVLQAGMDDMDFKNKFTAIKIHFGEPGNLAYLRPNYTKAVVDVIKKKGGKVFLTDCNTLYVFLLYYIYKKATFLVVRWLREHRGPRFDSWSGNESPHAATKTQKFLKNKQLPWRPVVRTRWFCHMGHRFNVWSRNQDPACLVTKKKKVTNYRENSLAPSGFHLPGPLLGGLLQLVTWCLLSKDVFLCMSVLLPVGCLVFLHFHVFPLIIWRTVNCCVDGYK